MANKKLIWADVVAAGMRARIRQIGSGNYKNVPPDIKRIGGSEYILMAWVNIDNCGADQLRTLDMYAYQIRERGVFVRIIKIAGASHAVAALYVRPRTLSDQDALNYLMDELSRGFPSKRDCESQTP